MLRCLKKNKNYNFSFWQIKYIIIYLYNRIECNFNVDPTGKHNNYFWTFIMAKC